MRKIAIFLLLLLIVTTTEAVKKQPSGDGYPYDQGDNNKDDYNQDDYNQDDYNQDDYNQKDNYQNENKDDYNKKKDDAYADASSTKSTPEGAKKIANYVKPKDRPKWYQKWYDSRIYPYAWAIYDTKQDKHDRNYNLWLYPPQAYHLAVKANCAYNGQTVQNVMYSTVKYVKKYGYRWYCYLSEDYYTKGHYTTVCWDVYNYKLHVALYYDYYSRSYQDLGDETSSSIAQIK